MHKDFIYLYELKTSFKRKYILFLIGFFHFLFMEPLPVLSPWPTINIGNNNINRLDAEWDTYSQFFPREPQA